MKSMFNDIGLVTAGLRAHLTRLASIEKDPEGSTSTMEDEETDDEKALREQAEEDARLGEDPDDDRSRRGRETAAYRELQADRDRLKSDLEKQQRQTQELTERFNKSEREKTDREKTNAETNAHLGLAKQRSREIVAEINKLDPNDPERAAKVYDTILEKVYEDLPKVAQDISTRTARETFQREQKLDRDQSEAKRVTLDALKAAGLDDEDYELVEALAIAKGTTDPGWFDRVAPEKQIDALVDIVKGRIVKTTRESQEFQDEKDRHRKPMRGVIDRGSQTRRVRDQEEEPDRTGPGSILEDMARAKRAKLQSTKVMLRQAER